MTADEGSILNPSHIAGVGARQETPRPYLLVQFNERAAFNHLSA
jgi:hypothetical protein